MTQDSASLRINPTAVIASDAELGEGCTVGPYAVIEEQVTIGRDCHIAAHAVIKKFTTIGEGNLIHEGAIVGGTPQDLSFRGAQTSLTVGDRNVIREGVTIHRATAEGSSTIVGDDNFVMAYAHIAHNCRLGNRVIIANNVALAGHVELEDRVFISGGVVVHQYCRLGEWAMIGGNSKIVQDCLPYVVTDGVPARARGLNLVGLRRGGLPAEEIQALKRAYRTLFRSGLLLEDALQQLGFSPDLRVQHLVQFIRSSPRGFCHERS